MAASGSRVERRSTLLRAHSTGTKGSTSSSTTGNTSGGTSDSGSSGSSCGGSSGSDDDKRVLASRASDQEVGIVEAVLKRDGQKMLTTQNETHYRKIMPQKLAKSIQEERKSKRVLEIPVTEFEARDSFSIMDLPSPEELVEGLKQFVFGAPRKPATARNMRSYVSNLQQFAGVNGDARLSVEDKISGSKYFSLGYRATLLTLAYLSFPYLQRVMLPSLSGINIDDLTSTVTGEFAPVMDVLYALLASNTIGILQDRQEKIQDVVNEELCELRILSWMLITLANDYRGLRRFECLKLLVPIWKYSDLLVFSSRADELARILGSDMLYSIYQALHELQIGDMKVEDSDKRDRIKQTATEAGFRIEKVLKLRTLRLDKEGQGVPGAILSILDSLSAYILVSYVLLSAGREVEPLVLDMPARSISSIALTLADKTSQIIVDVGRATVKSMEAVPNDWAKSGYESLQQWHLWPINAEAALFAVLASQLIIVRNLYRDLDNPFDGASHIRRTVSTTSLYSIRSEIEETFAEEGLSELLDEVRGASNSLAQERSKRAQLRRRERRVKETGRNLAWEGMQRDRVAASLSKSKVPKFNLTRL